MSTMDRLLVEHISRAIEVTLPAKTAEDMKKCKEMAYKVVEAINSYNQSGGGEGMSDRLTSSDIKITVSDSGTKTLIIPKDCDVNYLVNMAAQLKDVMRENERLREVLSFYADWPNNYKPKEFEMDSAIINDGGKKAKEALSYKESK